MSRIFIDREEELKTLSECWSSKGFRFVVIYGRRRIGKTELIKEFIKDKKSIYFLCSNRKIQYNLRKFSESICRFIGIPKVSFNSFQDAFDALLSKISEKIVIAIDEFGYLVREDPGVLSDFQEIVDEKLKEKNIMLILCGSSISMIETRVLGYKSPLYGRATDYMRVGPLDFHGLKQWFPESTHEDMIKIYSVTNNVPKYLEFFSGKNVEEEIIRNFFNSTSFLFGDAIRILSEELRDYTTYIQVLEAIALGYNRINEIGNYAFIQPKDTFFYLKVLSSLGIVERIIPILSPKKAKRGMYFINDNYFNFWFKFISPFHDEIENNNINEAIENFHNQFNTYLGEIFERVARKSLANKKLLPFKITKIGKWWHKNVDIDIIALNERTKEISFFEVKWKDLKKEECEKILEELKKKAEHVNWHKNERKEFYGVIAKSIEEKEELKKNYLIYELPDILI